MGKIKLYGIRHHGPGSSRNLLNALDHQAPDLILIEAPSDAQSLIQYVSQDMIDPPAAIMIYNPKDLKQYAYYPFTSFSPEWIAMKYGLLHNVATEFFDLPQQHGFLLSEDVTVMNKEKGFTKDPFGYMARISGFDDPERWWEDYIEQQQDASKIFDTILELMIELRKSDVSEKKVNLVREAYMRESMRSALEKGYQNVAVVCGAWHTPMLANLDDFSKSDDKKVLKGLKKVPIVSTWVPWSYSRLSKQSGYSSGVISPYWYEALFSDPANAVARWMSRCSKILHELGHQVSPAHTIESSRLAENLAYLRGKPMAGINELFDAVTAVHTRGDEALLNQLKDKLLMGEKTGTVSPEVPTVPLLKDLENQLKQLRLFRSWKSEGLVEKKLDLRKDKHLLASRLFHRLQLLEIDWASQKDLEHNPLGTFHEYWDLEWFPEYEMQIIEASIWGNNIEDACQQLVKHKLGDDDSFENLGSLLFEVLHADLPNLVQPISKKISDLGNLSDDVLLLMKIFPPLVWSLRYGNTAAINTDGIQDLIDQLLPRICILLPNSVKSISEEVANDTFDIINQLHQGLLLLSGSVHQDTWIRTLALLAMDRDCNPLIKGGALRILIVKEKMSDLQILEIISFNLSSLHEPFYPSHFVEGLLHSSGWLLVQKPELRGVVDKWLLSLEEQNFISVLPILRRTFSTFSTQEKEILFNLLFSGKMERATTHLIQESRKELVLPVLHYLLD